MVKKNHKHYMIQLLEKLDKNKTENSNLNLIFNYKTYKLYIVNLENLYKLFETIIQLAYRFFSIRFKTNR